MCCVAPAGTPAGGPGTEVAVTGSDVVFVVLTVALFALLDLVVRGVGKL
jgi:hypothetical protein